jgi:16S rRNA (cytidine1402-2'-O)-methyltransferase
LSKTLSLLGLPIGNMGDVSWRLREYLETKSIFYVEDTRNFFKLLNLMEIPSEGKVIYAFHEHNQERVLTIIDKHIEQDDICVASDAGSPILSDPGFPLVRGWLGRGGRIESISGPSAALVALEVSGLAPQPFMFHGFLPKKKESFEAVIQQCSAGVTHIFFDSPHRIRSTVEQLCHLQKEASVCVVRELTKKFEEHYRFEAKDYLEGNIEIKEKGEFVLLFHSKNTAKSGSIDNGIYEELADSYLKKPSKKSLARLIAQIKGGKVSEYYSQL